MCCPCRRRERPMKMPTTEASAVPAPGQARFSRSSLEHLRLRLRYERLRAAGRRWMGYLRLRLRYERLRAARRRPCPTHLHRLARPPGFVVAAGVFHALLGLHIADGIRGTAGQGELAGGQARGEHELAPGKAAEVR